jgi:NitT/TauT family transport system ATP-binding protein
MDVFVENLTQVWPGKGPGESVRALDGVTHHFRSGHFSCLLGPSGCGKSTLVQMVGGIERPSSGQIRIVNPSDPGAQSRRPGQVSIMMWQGLNLFPWRTVLDNVGFGLEMAQVPRAEREQRARAMIMTVGLRGFEQHRPDQLSGGMRQRVALARALIMERPILLMDEPFAALDAQTKIVMQEELLRIVDMPQRSGGKKTVLFVTHAIEEAILLGDEVVVMTARPGRIKEVMPVDLPRPRDFSMVNTPAFGALFDRAFHLIREEVSRAMAQQDAAA